MPWPVIVLALVTSAIVLAVVIELSARRIRPMRPWALLAAASAAAIPVAIVLHNVLSAVIRGDEAVSFVLALIVAPIGLTAAVFGAALVVARDPREHDLATSLLIAGLGLALFGGYGLFALAVTALVGGNPPYQALVEQTVVPVAVTAVALGTLSAVAVILTRRIHPAAV